MASHLICIASTQRKSNEEMWLRVPPAVCSFRLDVIFSLPFPIPVFCVHSSNSGARQESRGPVTHLVCSTAVIYNDEMGDLSHLTPSSAFVGSGPQNNVEALLVSVSEFEPLFQGCTCTGFSLTI
jgi:hypothetical protein